MSSHQLVEGVTPGLKPRPTYWQIMYIERVAKYCRVLGMYTDQMRSYIALNATRQGAQ